VLNIFSETKGGDAAAILGIQFSGTNSFRPLPHHSANPCAGAVPQRLDAQATELGTCLWAHRPLSTSHHFSPGNSGLF